ncbi:ORFIV [Mirabilis mosaic virus]|uniref:Coat protein n=1 Tax=Mirabilis mosaic virus TaxID=194445 RepID=Q8JTA3_9VIRU|nr:hypothetical protein [Mirabilis mosaic virus]AAM53127.1 ORFIV [Mirabilis mosaic virus]
MVNDLEEIFFNKLNLDEEIRDEAHYEEIQELVQILSMEDHEIEEKFINNENLRNRYFSKEESNSLMKIVSNSEDAEISEPETENQETDYSTEESIDFSEEEELLEQLDNLFPVNQETQPNNKRHAEEQPSTSGTGKYYRAPFQKGTPGDRPREIGTINIDCIGDLDLRRKIIDKWINEIDLIVQTSPNDFTTSRSVLVLMEHRSDGMIRNFIKKASWSSQMTGSQTPQDVAAGLYTMFVGVDYATDQANQIRLEKEKAKQTLTNAQLCDICLLDDFTCLFEKNLVHFEMSEMPAWVETYLRKIPIVGEISRMIYNETKSPATTYSLAFATRIVKTEIAKICEARSKAKQLKRFSQCCKKLSINDSENNQFGCNKPSYSSKRKKYEKSRRKVWKKTKRKFAPSKYFKRKSSKKDKNPRKNFCPQGKKKCRCWICSEEGHYANECPNRSKNPERVKILIKGYQQDYEPVEDMYEGTLHVYSYEYDTDSE